ncbi:MAG: tryptophan synthase subunit alpha [Ilumatobacteraceae bacterium]
MEAAVSAGADAIEIGIPFSDPVIDGPIIQQASQAALDDGATPPVILTAVSRLDVDRPLAVMTYYNLVHHEGHERFASRLAESGIAACIVPDLPLDESGPWCEAADAAGVETVMLAAPTASDERLGRIVTRCRGFVYSVGLLGVTGERASLAATATELAARLMPLTDLPVLVGVGVSDAAQAAQAVRAADGVVQGASVMRRLMESGPDAVGDYVAEVRAAIDGRRSMIELPRPADVLPHRPPFLFVDELVSLSPGERATGRWSLTGDEWFFAGHFPGRPTLPGVLMCEAIAQVGAIAVLTDDRFAGKLPLFGGLDGARFRRQVVPGDTLTLEVELGRMSARAGKGTGRALLDDAIACECSLLFVVVDA